MTDLPILTLVTFLPLVGALFILFVRGQQDLAERNAKYVALWTSLVTFVLSLFMLSGFDAGEAGYQMVEERAWLGSSLDIQYRMGVDGISIWFVLLSTGLVPVCILASWDSIQKRIKEYMVAFLVLEAMMVGMFCALDMVLFYIFFEGVLIPMFLIIGIWGGKNRIYASFKFFLYTLLGSLLMLVAMVALYAEVGSTDMRVLAQADVPVEMQTWLWLAFFAAFAVKVPMWPVHTWLPDAHVEAPTAGSVILAGVLLKMGGYGFIRFNLPMLPDASVEFQPLVFFLSVVAIIYTSLVALAQQDMKKLIAYSSVAHMGFVTLGLFSGTSEGIQGAVYQMLSHGVVSAALFLCVGVVYDRLHTREIGRYGGLVSVMPRYAILMMIFLLGSVGLPGTSGFVGEFLALLGTFEVHRGYALFAALGMVLGAAYMLLLYRRMIFGEVVNDDVRAMTDLTRRESALLIPMALLVIWMGVYPQSFLSLVEPSVEPVVATLDAVDSDETDVAATAGPEGDHD